MSLRASSGEHEAKKLLQSRTKYEQRFFGIYKHLIMFSPSSEHEAKKPLQSSSKYEQRFFGAGVLAALSSRAAVSLSYLTARAKLECWKVVVNLVFLALG
jgi:hypothetical protein